jgi:hypothetical protein
MAKEPRRITAFGASPESFNESRRSRNGNNEIENEEIISNDVHSSAHNSTHNDVHNPAHKHTHKDVHSSTHKHTHNFKITKRLYLKL